MRKIEVVSEYIGHKRPQMAKGMALEKAKKLGAEMKKKMDVKGNK